MIEPGDLVHCDVGLTSLGLRTDTQRNGYVLRPGETTAPAGLRDGAARRQPDAGPHDRGARAPAAPATRCSPPPGRPRRAEGIDADVYSHPVGFHGHGAGPAIGQWDAAGRRPRAPATTPCTPTPSYALELAVRRPVPEWGGQCVRMALEQGIALTADGVEYLDGRQTELILI